MTGRKIKLSEELLIIDGEHVSQGKMEINSYSGRYEREEALSIWSDNMNLCFLG
jgi:hypothetical protein